MGKPHFCIVQSCKPCCVPKCLKESGEIICRHDKAMLQHIRDVAPPLVLRVPLDWAQRALDWLVRDCGLIDTNGERILPGEEMVFNAIVHINALWLQDPFLHADGRPDSYVASDKAIRRLDNDLTLYCGLVPAHASKARKQMARKRLKLLAQQRRIVREYYR